MISDNELLELAAKAAGLKFKDADDHMGVQLINSDGEFFKYWHPLIDDGDALRLAVKLNIEVSCYIPHIVCTYDKNGTVKQLVEKVKDDRYAATRRTIVRAAAEIGKVM